MSVVLPAPDIVLSERLVLCETRLSDDAESGRDSSGNQASVCDVLQLAARKAVGCGVDGGAVEAEPCLVLSPDCKHLAVKEPCSRRISLLAAHDSFKEVLTTLVPLPVSQDGEVVADTVLSCSWSADSKLLLVACKSSAVYLFDSTGRLLCHWDPSWSWAQLQLVAACHGPGNTILILTAARVVFLVAHNGDKHQAGSSAGVTEAAASSGGSSGGFTQQQLQLQQQQVLEKYSIKRYHTAVSAIGYDDKSGLLVIAGDSGSTTSSSRSSSSGGSQQNSSSGAVNAAASPAAAFMEEGVTVSVWQLQDRQLNLRFSKGAAKGGPGMVASTVASALGVDRAALSAAAATRWGVVFSPLLEYVALLTGGGSVYLFSLTENCLVDPSSGFAGRSATSHGPGSPGSTTSPTPHSLSPRERTGTGLKPKHIPLTPYAVEAGGGLVRSGSCKRSVAWWGPRVLAVAEADGSVSLVRLPESVNILGAAPIRFAAGARVVANYSGSRGLLVAEPISAVMAAAAAGTTAAGAAAAAVGHSLHMTGAEATYAADASAAVGVSAVLAAKRSLAAAATASDIHGLRGVNDADGGEGGRGSSSRVTAWVAHKLGVSGDELAAAAAAGSSGSIAGWRLVLLAERTPQQMVQVHLRLKDWGSALNISKAYGLDTDAVYLARWSDAPVSRSSIQDNLPKIKSRRTRVAECLTRVAPDYESARLLISYGLRETAAHAEPPVPVAAAAAGHAAAAAAAGSAFVTPMKGPRPAAAASAGAPATPGGLTGPAGPNAPMAPGGVAEAPRLESMSAAKAAEVRWWRLQRLKLLALNDRLETCMALKRSSYDPELFSVLRTEPLPKAAAALAAAGNVAGLTVLLQRHKSTLAPRLLQLLSALPESLDPRMFAALIPRASSGAAAAAAAGPAAHAVAAPRVTKPVGVGNMHAKGLRKVDWVESEETYSFLAAAAAGSSAANGAQAAPEARASDSATGAVAVGALAHMASIDAAPGLPISAVGEEGSSRSGSVGLSSASSLDFSSRALCAEETSVMMHATEELERYCSVNGANKRTLPTDAEIASWLASRALQLDLATGQLPAALQLLEFAVDKGYGAFQVLLTQDGRNTRSAVVVGDGGAHSGQQVAEGLYVLVNEVLTQGRVLLQLVTSCWPTEQQQQDKQQQQQGKGQHQEQEEGTNHIASSTRGEDTFSTVTAAVGDEGVSHGSGVAAAGEAAAAALPPLWSVTLQQWVTVGLLPQLLAVLSGGSRDTLQQDLKERVLPLLKCYSHEQRVTALEQLLVYWVAGPTAAASASQPQRGSSGSGAGGSNSGSNGSNGIMLAAALLAGEAELLQFAAAASSLLAGEGTTTSSNQQQQQLLTQAAAAAGGSGLGPMLWDGDVAAMVSAVLAAVSACQATNQWARVEQLLDAAGAGLLAAAAVHGVALQQHERQTAKDAGRVSSSSDDSYGSAAESSGGDESAIESQPQEQQQLRQQGKEGRGGAASGEHATAGGDGWGDGWGSEEAEQEHDWHDASGPGPQQHRQAAALAATEPWRAAVQQFVLRREAVQLLQTQLDALRGQTRAARLLTKQGCCVSIQQVAAADGRAVQEWLSKLLGRAERLGAAWPEAQWAQVWHDLMEARQAGLAAQLPAAHLAAAFLRVLLLAQQYHLAVQLLPLSTQQQLAAAHFGTPTAGTPTAAVGMDGMGAFDLAMDAHYAQHAAGAGVLGEQQQLAGRDGERPATAEAALSALTGSSGGRFTGSSRFGVRRALHHAAGAAVSTAVGSTAKLMGVSAHLVGSTAHLVGSTAQAVQYGTGGVMGATAGLVSGTASLVSSAATFAAEAAAKAGKAGLAFKGSAGGSAVLKDASGLLTVQEAESVVVQVSQELLASAASLEDAAVVAAEAVLQLLPPECKAAAAQRDSVAVLRRLPEFGVSLLPAQLTSLPDKHQLLQRILFGRHTYAAAAAAAAGGCSSSNAGSSVAPWRRLGDVLELAALLGFGSEDEQNEVRLMAAEAALTAGEVGVATHLCLQLAAVRYAPAWHLAAELASPQRFADQRKQRAAKVKQLVQQEQQVQQHLRESQQGDDTQQEQQSAGDSLQQGAQQQQQEVEAGPAIAAAAEQQQQLEVLQLEGAGDGDGSSASIPSPATPGAAAVAAATAAAVDAPATAASADEDQSAASAGGADSSQAEPVGVDPYQAGGDSITNKASLPSAPTVTTTAAPVDITAADIEGAKQLPSADSTDPQQASDAGLQAPGTPLGSASPTAAHDTLADASATVSQAGAVVGEGRRSEGVGRKGATGLVLSAARLLLPPKDRQKLLAFAAYYCPRGELPALTDDLVAAQQEVTQQQQLRQQQLRQQQLRQQQQQDHQGSQEQHHQHPSLMLPLQQPSAPAFRQQRQQLLRAALAAAAAAPLPKGCVDPFRGLFSFGDPFGLLAVLLSCSSPAEARDLLEDALAYQLASGTNGSSSRSEATAAGGSYCCLQRLLVVGAAAQLLLSLQQLPQGALLEVVAATPSSKASCSQLKLPHHQELLLQLLHIPLPQLQLAASRLLEQPQQQQLLPPEAGEAVAAAGAFVSRLQQISDGRQLLQWLPGIETGRFFAGDKPYQEQVLIELASKAGQMAVQWQQQDNQQAAAQQSAAAEALMAQAQQLAASYGADPFQLELWFVHSLVLYAPDISQPEAQSLVAAHMQQLLPQPAAAAAHLFFNTYPLLPASAAGQCACVLGQIHAALQAFCAQQGQQVPGGADSAAAAATVPAAVTVAMPQLEKLRELLVKSSKALTGLAAKALIGGHVALMVGPAVASAAAVAAPAVPGSNTAAAAPESTADGAQQEQGASVRSDAAAAAAAAAVAAVDLQMALLEAASAVAAFVSAPAQAGVVAKFIRHINTLAEMHARASVGDKPKQQALQRLAQGVSPGLPHLLLFMRTMSSGVGPDQQQQFLSDADEQGDGLARVESAESVMSFQSAVSVNSSLSGQNPAHPGHNPAAALAIEWATARARYAGTSGRQQLLNCSALQLSGVASWLALAAPQPLSADAIGQMQPLAMGPGLQLQMLSDVITLVTNPEAQLPGLVTSAKRGSSGGSSRGSSFAQGSVTAEQAAATAVAAAAALTAGSGAGPIGGLTALMRDDPAAIAAWQPPCMPANLAPKRRELVLPLLQAAARIVARHIVLSAIAAAPSGTAAGAAAEAAIDGIAALVSQTASVVGQEQQQEAEAVAGSGVMAGLLKGLLSSGSFSAVSALQLSYQLASLQQGICAAMGLQQQQPLSTAPSGSASDAPAAQVDGSSDSIAAQQAQQAVAAVLQQLTQAALQNLQQQVEADQAAESLADSAGSSDAVPAAGRSGLKGLQQVVRCLESTAAPSNTTKAVGSLGGVDFVAAAAAAADGADSAEQQAAASGSSSSSWLTSSIQQLRGRVWDQLQEHQAQLPAEAYSSSLVAELLELQETVSSGAAWPGWSTAAGGGAAGAAAAAGELGAARGRQKSGGAGLLLARTMTALSKQFPGLKASADDVSSVDAAVGMFSGLVSSCSPLSPSQCAALIALLTEVWKEGAALPQPQVAAAAAVDVNAAAATDASAAAAAVGAAEDVSMPAAAAASELQQEQEQEQLAASTGLAAGRCRVSQLHSCWYELLAAMLQAGYVQDLLALLDKGAAAAFAGATAANASSGDAGGQAQQEQQQGQLVLFVSESEAQQLVAAAAGPLGPAGQAVLGLLLPYRSCQQSVLDQLRQGQLVVGSQEPWAGQLLLLLLLRGFLPQLAAAAAGGGCGESGVQDAGSSPQQQQLYHLYSLLLQPVLAAPPDSSELAWAYLTCLFPHAVSQLCSVPDYAGAAALVAAKMRPSSSLCGFAGGVLLLQRYLEVTMLRPWQPPVGASSGSPLWLPCCEGWLASNGATVAATAHTRLVSALRQSDGGV